MERNNVYRGRGNRNGVLTQELLAPRRTVSLPEAEKPQELMIAPRIEKWGGVPVHRYGTTCAQGLVVRLDTLRKYRQPIFAIGTPPDTDSDYTINTKDLLALEKLARSGRDFKHHYMIEYAGEDSSGMPFRRLEPHNHQLSVRHLPQNQGVEIEHRYRGYNDNIREFPQHKWTMELDRATWLTLLDEMNSAITTEALRQHGVRRNQRPEVDIPSLQETLQQSRREAA